eukprot:gene60-10960_t
MLGFSRRALLFRRGHPLRYPPPSPPPPPLAATVPAPSPATYADNFTAYLDLIRFDRPAGTLLLFWPSMWGLSLP